MEMFFSRDRRATTVDQFIAFLDSDIRWYNAMRIKVPLSSLITLQYPESSGITANQSKMLLPPPT